MSATPWLTDDERQAWRNMSLMHLQLNAVLSRQLDGTDLSLQDYLVLAGLTDHEAGRMRVSDLGLELGWEKSRVSHHVSRMEVRGLVRRVKCDSDGRGWYVEITPVGRRAIEAAAPGHVQAVRDHFVDVLSAAQLREVDRISRRVLDHLARQPSR